jgi:hypothetical protein
MQDTSRIVSSTSCSGRFADLPEGAREEQQSEHDPVNEEGVAGTEPRMVKVWVVPGALTRLKNSRAILQY